MSKRISKPAGREKNDPQRIDHIGPHTLEKMPSKALCFHVQLHSDLFRNGLQQLTDKKYSPNEAYEELNTLSNPNQLNQKVFASNSFKINDDVIIEKSADGVNKKTKAPDVEFTYRTSMGLNTCYLKIRGNMLKMKMVTGQGKEYEYTYKFVECD